MEIMIPSSGMNIDLTLQREPVILEHPIYCGYCLIKMNKIDDNTYKCSSCGAVHKDI